MKQNVPYIRNEAAAPEKLKLISRREIQLWESKRSED